MSYHSEDEVKVVDHGGTFEFITHEHTRFLPPGIYYPSTDPNGAFFLTRHETKEQIQNKIAELKAKWEKPTNESVELGPADEGEPPVGWHAPLRNPVDNSHLGSPAVELGSTTSTNTSNNDSETDSSSESEPPSSSGYDWVNQKYFPLEKYNPGLGEAEDAINRFLDNKEFYESNGINYRRSLLFFGNPGTGKTQYIMEKSRKLVVNHNAVVVRIENEYHLDTMGGIGADVLADCIPNRLKVIVIEEISEYFEDRSKRMLLTSLMDSAVLRDNVVFLATTNHPQDIPENVIDRPSRLDLLLGVFHADNDISYIPKFYEHLMGDDCPVDMDSAWIKEAHQELSPAYMKEMFIYSKVLGVPVKEGYEKLKRRRQLVKGGFKRGSQMGF